MTARHRWGEPERFHNERDEHVKTERACLNGCGTFRVTHHPPQGQPWVDYQRETDAEWLVSSKRPECVAVTAGVAA